LETILVISGFILLILGLAGCLLPVIPGPPLAYASLLALQLTDKQPFSMTFLLVWAGITVLVVLADLYIPILGTKKFGGTKWGIRGAAAGLVVGLFFPPWGIIAGPFLGAFAGELMNRQSGNKALRSAVGSFLGFVGGTVMKLGSCVIMGYYFVAAVI